MDATKDYLRTVELPEGFTTRPARMEDAEMVVEMYNACSEALGGIEKHHVSDTLTEWSLPSTHLDQDTLLVFAPDGKLAGYGEFWDINEPYVTKQLWYRVHPEFNNLGIDLYLITWAEEKARLAVDRAPEGARVVVHGNSSALDRKMQRVFESLGYIHNRTGLCMLIELNDPPVEPKWPEGIQLLNMVSGKDERRIIRAVYDSFSDHWGFVPEPFEAYLERWLHFLNHNLDLDPELWFMALDGDDVAGISLCSKEAHNDPEMGWVGTLGVCRPWRKRGLGMALLQHSFFELHKRGQRQVGLHVDADSLTGATRLYEKAGMHSDPGHAFLFYEKELRTGVELSKQHL